MGKCKKTQQQQKTTTKTADSLNRRVEKTLQEELVNGELLAGCSLPLEVDTGEKQVQKATINNSFRSKTKPAGTLGGSWALIHLSPLTVTPPHTPRLL